MTEPSREIQRNGAACQSPIEPLPPVVEEGRPDGKCSVQPRQSKLDWEPFLLESLQVLPYTFEMNKISETEPAKPDIASALVDFQRQSLSKEMENTVVKSERKFLHCPICRCLYVIPVTLSCGHTLCKTCVLSEGSGQNSEIDCRQCGSRNFTNKPSVNVLITHLLQQWFPVEYESEVKELENVQRGSLQGDQKKVVASLSNVLENSPFNFTALKWRSQAFFQMGMCKQALKDADLACRLRPFLPCGFYQRGVILVGMDEYDQAAICFARCVALDSSNAEYHAELISCLNKLVNSKNADGLKFFLKPGSFSKSPSKQTGNAGEANNQERIGRELNKRRNLSKINSTVVTESVFLSKKLKRTLQETLLDNNGCQGVCLSPNVENSQSKRSRVGSFQMEERNIEDLECEICYSILFQPVTTACGHTFCRGCLQRSLDFRPECPYCRQSLDCCIVGNIEVTWAVKEMTKTLFPDAYAERERHLADEKEHWKGAGIDANVEVPIFVCMLAFPYLRYPLHIFEPRYRLMIRKCLELGTRMFGMCSMDPDKGFSDYGTMLYIEKVDVLSDGRSIIQTTARRRFRVISRATRDGFNIAKVEWLEDEAPKAKDEFQELEVLHADCGRRLELWFNNLTQLQQTCITNAIGPMPCLEEKLVSNPNGPSWLWWALAAIPLQDRAKLIILSMTSLNERLRSIRRFLGLLITVK